MEVGKPPRWCMGPPAVARWSAAGARTSPVSARDRSQWRHPRWWWPWAPGWCWWQRLSGSWGCSRSSGWDTASTTAFSWPDARPVAGKSRGEVRWVNRQSHGYFLIFFLPHLAWIMQDTEMLAIHATVLL